MYLLHDMVISIILKSFFKWFILVEYSLNKRIAGKYFGTCLLQEFFSWVQGVLRRFLLILSIILNHRSKYSMSLRAYTTRYTQFTLFCPKEFYWNVVKQPLQTGWFFSLSLKNSVKDSFMVLVYRSTELFLFRIKYVENWVVCLQLYLKVPNKTLILSIWGGGVDFYYVPYIHSIVCNSGISKIEILILGL